VCGTGGSANGKGEGMAGLLGRLAVFEVSSSSFKKRVEEMKRKKKSSGLPDLGGGSSFQRGRNRGGDCLPLVLTENPPEKRGGKGMGRKY